MISPSITHSKHQPFAAPTIRHRLLIISDSSDRLSELSASLGANDIDITSATSPEELGRACREGHDLAVVDVGPAQLAGVLRDLREGLRSTEIPVLVDASRLSAEPGLAGILPKYRAMPCSHADIIRLARRRITATTGGRHSKKML